MNLRARAITIPDRFSPWTQCTRVTALEEARHRPGDFPGLWVDGVSVIDGEVHVEVVLGDRRRPGGFPVLEGHDRIHPERYEGVRLNQLLGQEQTGDNLEGFEPPV
ncbi:MAG TPA: hypothetical protein VGS09_05685 [Actinomycetota bacterium]|nr:hypothetical protein [Actinomycetota bacterium]